ncbi:MAG: LysM peptidoglycan-binding domain-containing protein [Thermoleophilia bacterium]|nr:LysM peptidoglycan-binding domain-containing protein [Thermoleophilia bacterium]
MADATEAAEAVDAPEATEAQAEVAPAEAAQAEAPQAAAPAAAPKQQQRPAQHAAPKPAQHAQAKPKPAQHQKRTYTVKSGDTLSAIGARFGVSWQEIARVNRIPNPDLIYPGQTFVIPD